MNIGLIDVDGHNFPNLALMKISAYHKAAGDSVEWWNGLKWYDRVYMSKVFDSTYTPDMEFCINSDIVIKGGTGYIGKSNVEWGEPDTGRIFQEADFYFEGEWVDEIEDDGGIKYWHHLPNEIEHMMPDYFLYGIKNTAYGFLTRGCPRGCKFCIVSEKEGRVSHQVANLTDFHRGQKEIKLLDPNILACKDHEGLLNQLAGSGAWVDFTQGLDIRLISQDNVELLNRIKTKMVHFAWDDPRHDLTEYFKRFAEHSKIQDRRKRCVYVLTNFESSHEEDLYRINTLRELDFDPYVMIYDKPHAPKQTRYLQRWVNNKRIFRTIDKFEDYDHRIG